MKEQSDKTEQQKNLVNGFRAYLQTVITAEQSGQIPRLPSLPGPKMIDYCYWLTKFDENTLARELALPVWGILKQIHDATMYFYRPLYQKAIKEPAEKAQYEKILWQLDFALALIMRHFTHLARFRAKSTKCSDLIVDIICEMNQGEAAGRLIRRYQKDFPEELDILKSGDGGFPEQFAWDTYRRVEILDRLADRFPGHVKLAARRMQGWPMITYRHANNRKRFNKIADQLELGVDYPIDATNGAHYRPDTPLVRYLDPMVFWLIYVKEMLESKHHNSIEEEKKDVRCWLADEQEEWPTDEQVEAARPLISLPPLRKDTAAQWAEKVVVPFILVTDAKDWKKCEEPALCRIANQKGVKSRATFKSRLLAAVSTTLRRMARAK